MNSDLQEDVKIVVLFLGGIIALSLAVCALLLGVWIVEHFGNLLWGKGWCWL